MTTADVMRSMNLQDSIISLERQAERQFASIEHGDKAWCGVPMKKALAETLKAMIVDCTDLADKHGGGDWATTKRKWASDRLGKLLGSA